MRILIAEDEIEIAKALKVMLEKSKYAVDAVHSGTDALDYILCTQYDIIVLDIMMPGMDGIEVLTKIRNERISSPVMLLTAKSEIEDRVLGLNAGADDYLPKPFAASEFLARINALSRRCETFTSDILVCGQTNLDCGKYELSHNGKVSKLNNKEFQLMELFMRNSGHIFSSEKLMDKIWGLETETEIDVVWTYIGFLRKKLKSIGADAEIKTVRGAGYSLEVRIC